jgi:hypothetical protein
MADEMTRTQRVAWEALQNPYGQAETRPMPEVVEKLQKYVATYDQQHGYENFPDSILIDDILYGLGQALDDNYQYADGFERFKDFLRDYLKGSSND